MSRTNVTIKRKLYLNVYDLQDNSMTEVIGLGAYHSGLCIDGKTEWTFSQSGVFSHDPKGAGSLQGATPGQSCKFKQTVYLGETTFTAMQIENAISKLKQNGFQGDEYHVLSRNCNHFADALGMALMQSDKSVIPGWVNRGASIGSKFGGLFGSKQMKKKVEIDHGFRAFHGNGRSMSGNAPAPQQKKKGWFSSWFGSSEPKKKEVTIPVEELTPEQLRAQRLAKFNQ